MKSILAAALMIVTGSLGVGCASGAEPSDDDTITVDGNEGESVSLAAESNCSHVKTDPNPCRKTEYFDRKTCRCKPLDGVEAPLNELSE